MKPIIAWFAQNHVAANLLMAVILVAGVIVAPTIPQKAFPDIDIDRITIGVEYPGGAPEEVEEGVCIRIEEQIEGIEEIEEIRSTATEGACTVIVKLLPGSDASAALDEIRPRSPPSRR
jgi:multidrug efflux pump subunit AcrB